MEGYFRTRVSSGVYWVSYNVLGKMSEDLETNWKHSLNKNFENINTLADAIFVFQRLQFEEIDDTYCIDNGELIWEMHMGGKAVLDVKCGCCATVAAWVNQVLQYRYDEVGFFCLYRNSGSGHVMNYIYKGNKIFVIDFFPFLKKYKNGICQQTGERKDFSKGKYFTGLLYEIDSFDCFAKYYSRMTKLSGVEQIFWYYSSDRVSPIAVIEGNENSSVYIPDCYNVMQVGEKKRNIQLVSISVPQFDPIEYRFREC